jgi:hypothetical protein
MTHAENGAGRGTRAAPAGLIGVLVLGGMLHRREASAAEDDTELAKKTRNPVADLISVPFQSNFNFNTGSKDATVYILNVQPVIPIHLTHDWNLITRTIMPIINQPSLFPGPNSISGSALAAPLPGPVPAPDRPVAHDTAT